MNRERWKGKRGGAGREGEGMIFAPIVEIH